MSVVKILGEPFEGGNRFRDALISAMDGEPVSNFDSWEFTAKAYGFNSPPHNPIPAPSPGPHSLDTENTTKHRAEETGGFLGLTAQLFWTTW